MVKIKKDSQNKKAHGLGIQMASPKYKKALEAKKVPAKIAKSKKQKVPEQTSKQKVI